MWSNFEASVLEDETISNVFSSRSLFQISSDEEACRLVIKQEIVIYYGCLLGGELS